MRPCLLLLSVFFVVVFAACEAASSKPGAVNTPSGIDSQRDTYLTLGDSVAAGSGASSRATGYAEVLFEALSGSDETLERHVNLAEPGETSSSFVDEQLPKALDTVESGRVRLVTFAIGANDLLRLLRGCGTQLESEECRALAANALGELEANVATSLQQLQATDPDLHIVMLDYYNPLANLLPATNEFADRLNTILREAAVASNIDFVEIAPIFANREAALTRILNGDVHPNDEGHRLIAETLAKALQDRLQRLPALTVAE